MSASRMLVRFSCMARNFRGVSALSGNVQNLVSARYDR
jgi:hypothetical protein